VYSLQMLLFLIPKCQLLWHRDQPQIHQTNCIFILLACILVSVTHYDRSLSMDLRRSRRSLCLWLGVWTPWLATPLPKLQFQRPKIHTFSFGGRELHWLT